RDIDREAACARVAAEAGERRHEALAVDDHHRKDGAALDGDLEDLALLAREAEQRAGEDEVAGARDRQELGQPLDDSHQRRLDEQDRIQAVLPRAAKPAMLARVARRAAAAASGDAKVDKLPGIVA